MYLLPLLFETKIMDFLIIAHYMFMNILVYEILILRKDYASNLIVNTYKKLLLTDKNKILNITIQ